MVQHGPGSGDGIQHYFADIKIQFLTGQAWDRGKIKKIGCNKFQEIKFV